MIREIITALIKIKLEYALNCVVLTRKEHIVTLQITKKCKINYTQSKQK